MHILDEPRYCARCLKRQTTRAYGPENTPICRICYALTIRQAVSDISRHKDEPQAIDAWEPGQKI